jgi:hypothetical protein
MWSWQKRSMLAMCLSPIHYCLDQVRDVAAEAFMRKVVFLVKRKRLELQKVHPARANDGNRFGSLQKERGPRAFIQSAPAQRQDLQSHPFAHPYYWGGFVYTGL